MAADSFKDLRKQVVDAASFLVQSGAMSLSHHGNFSVRLPDSEKMLLTAVGSFDNLRPDHLALLDLEGNLLEGAIDPTNAEIVGMHAVVYHHRPEAGAVVHTHSPYATSFAVAGRPLECWYEAMVRLGMEDGVPLAHYGPRGSPVSVANIAAALASAKHLRAVLLANHGVLAFGPDPMAAARTVVVVEEAAQLALNAEALGGAKIIPPEFRRVTVERRDSFAREGTRQA